MGARNNVRGSLWNQWDLHLHTPSSFDYENKAITNEQIIQKLIQEEISVAVITDHHVIDIARIKHLQQLGGNNITILPGIELRSDQGGDPIHYICIFSEECNLDHVWTTMQGNLHLTQVDIKEKGGDHNVYVPIEDAAKCVNHLGGIITIHAGEKSNSIESIKNREQFQRRIKFDITKNFVSMMEIGQIKDIQVHKNIIFPKIGLDKPLIICSDNHNINNYSRKATTWLRSDPTFRGLLMVLNEPSDRVFIGDTPEDLHRIKNYPTKIINKVVFEKKESLPVDQKWFSNEVLFNPGLVAIIGNKGSGKSALADTIGLLGSSKNSDSFSFLSKHRFCHPTEGYAQHFLSTLIFNSGESITRIMNEPIRPEDAERVKYLPQDHIENICNELTKLGGTSFEDELKKVIYSHVPHEKRHGQHTLDKLIGFSASEKKRRIDSLIKSLRDVNRRRDELEYQLDPLVKNGIEERIKKKVLEIEAHNKLKPAVKENPAESGIIAEAITDIMDEIQKIENQRKGIEELIGNKLLQLDRDETRLAIANRVHESLRNFNKEWETYKELISEDTKELGIKIEDSIQVNINFTSIHQIIDAQAKRINDLKIELYSLDPPGLQERMRLMQEQIEGLKTHLDAPNREYQKYLEELANWEKRKSYLEGDETDQDSLNGLKNILSELQNVPKRISELKTLQLKLAKEIHDEKRSLADLYRELYGPVQEFINSHSIAKDKMKLEFKAQLADNGLCESFLELISHTRKGSFLGAADGKARMDSLIQETNWEQWESVNKLFGNIDRALHHDLRDESEPQVLLQEQLVKGKKPEDIFNVLFGLDYLEPRYVLKWAGKDLELLSPGERGTLLLVFYLLIEKGDEPLIIDQPEGNLDNLTVAKVLIDCIKEARKRRQVMIVTHNPNLAVVCDADQVIYSTLNHEDGSEIIYKTGSLENPEMNLTATDVLEGTRFAFDLRGAKYEISN